MGTNNDDTRLDTAMDALFLRGRNHAEGAGASSAAWDDRADASLRAAQQASTHPSGTLDALLAAPELETEPGEPASKNSRNGTQHMSDESNSKPPASRRPSLKDLAESVKNRPSTPAPSSVRAAISSDAGPTSSTAPASRHSLKDTLVALDGQLPVPPSAHGDVPASSRPLTPAPVGLRGSSPHSSAGPSSSGPASSAPASAAVVAMAPAAPLSNPTAVPPTKPSQGITRSTQKKPGGPGMAIAIAAMGLAAAAGLGLYLKSQSANVAAPTVAAMETAAPALEAAKAAPPQAAKPVEEAKPDGVLDLSQLDDAASAAPVGGPLPGGPLPAASGAAAPSAVASASPAKPLGPGENLDDAIRNRSGGPNGAGEDAEPAAAEGSKKNLPDVPPTGAVTSAVNAVKGSAKGCVAGADEPSSATITFGSSGAVQSVSVGGWAQGKPAAGCIKSALQAAKVPAFARPNYSTSVTIRP